MRRPRGRCPCMHGTIEENNGCNICVGCERGRRPLIACGEEEIELQHQ